MNISHRFLLNLKMAYKKNLERRLKKLHNEYITGENVDSEERIEKSRLYELKLIEEEKRILNINIFILNKRYERHLRNATKSIV